MPQAELVKAIQSDQPIKNSSEDIFGRQQFAHRIADVLSDRSDVSSLVVALNAPWGDGKTSVLNMIQEKLDASGTLTLTFNPWRYPTEDRLLVNFFKQLAEKIGVAIETEAESAAAKLQKKAPLFGIFNFLGFKADDAARALAGLFPEAEVDELKARISERLAEKKKQVVILMDDIDRLDVEEIQAVFRLVKLSAGFPHIAYVLAFDEIRVAQALKQKYAGIEDSGSGFLEKIVQVALPLPPINPIALLDLCELAIEDATKASRDLTPDERSRLVNYFRGAFRGRLISPRLCKRFSNSIQFVLPLMMVEIDIADMIFVEALKTFFPEVYAVLRSSGEQILDFTVGDELLGDIDASLSGFLSEQFRMAMVNVPAHQRPGLDDLLQELIPGLEKLGIFSSPSPALSGRKNAGKRLSNRRYYWRYFSYGIQPHDISDETVNNFLAEVPKHKPIFVEDKLEAFFTGTPPRSELLIEKLRVHEKTVNKETAVVLATGLGRLSRLLPPKHPDDILLRRSARYEMARLIMYLLGNNSLLPEERERAVAWIIQHTPEITFAVDLAEFTAIVDGELVTADKSWACSLAPFSRTAARTAAQRVASQATRRRLEEWDPENAQDLYIFWYLNDAVSLIKYVEDLRSKGIGDFLSFLRGLMGVPLQNLALRSESFVHRRIPWLSIITSLTNIRTLVKWVSREISQEEYRPTDPSEKAVAESLLSAYDTERIRSN